MATLVVVTGPSAGHKFALEAHRLVMVGRDPRCTFQLLDPGVSRMHLQVRHDEGAKKHLVSDFQSRNGVFLNDAKIEAETVLQHGDAMRIGNSTILYSSDDSPDAIRYLEVAHRHGGGYDRTVSIIEND